MIAELLNQQPQSTLELNKILAAHSGRSDEEPESQEDMILKLLNSSNFADSIDMSKLRK